MSAVLIMSAALVVAGGGSAAQAAPPAPAPLRCVVAAPDAAAAASLAARCRAEVEVLSARTEWNTTVALPDGSMRLDVSTGAVRTRVSGSWAKVDNSVVAKGGALRVASAVTPMRFSDGSGDEPFATIERDGHELSFDMPFDLPKPTVDGAQLTYASVLPGVDLVVTVNEDATGFSEVLRVASAKAAANPRLRDLTFPVETSAGIDVQAQDGGFVATGADGAPVFASPTPVMWDSSSVDLAPGKIDRAVGAEADLADPTVKPVGGEAVAQIPAQVSDDEVTITPDADLLTDPETIWPVFIDPGMSGSLNRRSAVRTVYGIKYDFIGDEGVGLCSTASSSTCSSTFRSRLLYQFAGLQALGNLEPGDIKSATFAVTGTHSNSCTPQPVTLYAVADFDQNTAYPGGSYWSELETLTIAHRADCPVGQQPRRIEFNAKAQATAVAAANTGVASFGIAANEDSMAYWKRYGWDASFSITYNRAPSAVTSLRTTGPDSACVTGASRPYIRAATPLLRGVVSDPDGGNVQGNFDLATVANPNVPIWDPPLTAAQGSGAEHAVQVPAGLLSDGGVYRWAGSGFDGESNGPWVACEFAVDLTAPVAPVVATVAGMPAVYTEGPAGSGGIGSEGRFTFSNGGSSDVVWYRYTFQGAQQKMAPAGSPTVAFIPSVVGSQTLTVESIDAAGWVSPARVYRFTVGFAGISDAWQLDEVSGTTAANAQTAGTRALTVSSTVTRVNGLGKDFNAKPTDLALKFDAAADTASTSAPIVMTDRTFSVMAFVKLDDVAGTYTAVSQDGSTTSGFELGHRVDANCPTGTGGHCWAFWMPGADSTVAPVAVLSDVPVRAGAWVQLTGVRNAGTGKLQLAVCDIGIPGGPATAAPKVAVDKTAPAAWLASGGFQVGRGRAAGVAARSWHGSVSQVRTYTGVVAVENLRTSCQNPFAIQPALNLPTTPETPPTPAPIPAPRPGEPGYNAAFVASQYRDLIRRDPTFSELVAVTAGLDAGQPLVSVSQGLTSSAEWHTLFVQDMYQRYLKRGGDPEGVATWMNAFGAGADTFSVELGFVNSQEYYSRAGGTDAGLVAALYTDVLGRGAGQSEIDSWVAVIRASGRGAATSGIVRSLEHINGVVDSSYRTVLGHGADPGGLNVQAGAIQGGMRLETLLVNLASSEEYRLYRVRAV
ncbi:DUF4214 domain-containing protein [Cellulomonas sp.]|uniref:DUF4214 domain-containing protein n=1 Tax=Cellulomonas sp. TaxID=40001 RepID=UPI003BA8F624